MSYAFCKFVTKKNFLDVIDLLIKEEELNGNVFFYKITKNYNGKTLCDLHPYKIEYYFKIKPKEDEYLFRRKK